MLLLAIFYTGLLHLKKKKEKRKKKPQTKKKKEKILKKRKSPPPTKKPKQTNKQTKNPRKTNNDNKTKPRLFFTMKFFFSFLSFFFTFSVNVLFSPIFKHGVHRRILPFIEHLNQSIKSNHSFIAEQAAHPQPAQTSNLKKMLKYTWIKNMIEVDLFQKQQSCLHKQ